MNRDFTYFYSIALENGFSSDQAERYADKKIKEQTWQGLSTSGETVKEKDSTSDRTKGL